jgi:outer membrane protein OmpA-like peptidoglycan-associated protein
MEENNSRLGPRGNLILALAAVGIVALLLGRYFLGTRGSGPRVRPAQVDHAAVRLPQPTPQPTQPTPTPAPAEIVPPFAPQQGNIAASAIGGDIESITGDCGPGANGNLLIDGSADPTWEPSGALTFPREIVLSFFNREPVRLRSVVLTAPSGTSAPKDVEVWVSTSSPSEGFQKIAGLTFPPTAGDHVISFDPVEARFLKLTILSAQGPNLKIGEIQAVEAERSPDYMPLAVRNPDMAAWKTGPRHAAQRGIEWLQTAAVAWQHANNCFGCHVQSQVAMGLVIAEKGKYVVNRPCLDELAGFVQKVQHDDGSFHNGMYAVATSFAGMALAYYADLTKQTDPHLVKAAQWLLKQQDKTGAIPADHNEPPIDQGSIMTTANSVTSFHGTLQQTKDVRYARAAEKGLAAIASANPQTTQDKIYLILAFSSFSAGPRRKLVEKTVAQLKKEQRDDGGWAETAAMPGSNAYATGQVLYAFKQAGESIESEEFTKGVRFLLANQKPTGAWPSRNSQSGRPSEFAPTMWAVIGLAGSFRDAKCAEVSQQADRIVISMCSAALFDFDRYDLKPAAKSVLAQIKTTIVDLYPNNKLTIEGYTDDRGTEAYNLALSLHRAEAVAAFLKEQGIDAGRMESKGLGKSHPKYPNDTEEDRARNRRVEISLSTR